MSRLLIVAARPSAGEAIRLALRQAGRLEVLGYVNGRASADAAIRLARPDLILVDDMDCAAGRGRPRAGGPGRGAAGDDRPAGA